MHTGLTLKLRSGYWTLFLANGRALVSFASLKAAVEAVPEAEVIS